MSEKAQGKIPRETVVSDSNEKKWIIGSFIGIDGSAENYEAAEYNGKIPDHYPKLIKLKPPGDGTLRSEIHFFKQHANPKNIAKWIASKDHHYEYLALPYYLGSAHNKTIDNSNVMDFIVLERYGADLETLLAKHNNLPPKPTVLKIGYHILAVFEYLHQREIVYGNIQAYNIRMDLYDERAIYVLPQFDATDESDRNAKNFWSEYQHHGVRATTKRGDFESLLYNLIDWLGGILPWKNAPLNEIKDMKSQVFDDPKQFLKDTFPSCQCEDSSGCMAARKCVVSGKPVVAGLQAIPELMKQIASMNKTINCKPNYKAIEKILRNSLLNMYHVPTSRLQFSVPTFISDEDIDEKSSRRERKSFDMYIPGLTIPVDTLTHILAENCLSFDEVDALNNKYYGVVDVIDQLKRTKRIMYFVKPHLIREAWNLNTQELRTQVIEKWQLKGIKPGSYKAWKKATKDREKTAKSTTTYASMGNKKKNVTYIDAFATERRHSLGLEGKQKQQQKRCLESSSSSTGKSSNTKRRPKRFKPEISDTSSISASKSFEGDGEDDRPVDPANLSILRMSKQHLEKNEAVDESGDLFAEETLPDTTDMFDWLNVWLELREQTSMIVGSISSEPEVKAHQTLQLRVLREDFNLQLHRLRRLMNALSELPSDSDDVQRLNRIQQRWLNQLVWLEDCADKLSAENLSQLRDVLQDQDIVVWLIKELEITPEKIVILADREALRQQREHYQTVYQRIINKEAQMKMLLNEGRSALARSQNKKNETVQQLFLDVTESQWKALKKNSFKNHEKLEICVEHCEKYYQAQNLFLRWLNEVEQKFESYTPSSLNDIEKVLQELSSLCNEVYVKSGDIEQCKNLGRTFIGAVDEDKDDVLKNELTAMNDRYDKLYSNLLDRRNALKDINKHFAMLNKSLVEINDKIQVCHNELESYSTLEGATKDLNILHHIMELNSKIASTRKQFMDLVPKAAQQGIDASYLMNEIRRVPASTESLKTKLLDTCKKILEPQFRNIVECDNIMQLPQQIGKLKVLVSNVESVLGSDITNHAAT